MDLITKDGIILFAHRKVEYSVPCQSQNDNVDNFMSSTKELYY